MNRDGIAEWPLDDKGQRVATQKDPITGYDFCESCWNGAHGRNGCCTIVGCNCGCYRGNNKGLGKPHPPVREMLAKDEMFEGVSGFSL